MSVAELVRQSGRDHLPYLTPYPHGRGQTWFNRSGNGISSWINRMMYSALDKGHPTFTDFSFEKQHLWFRQFAVPRKFPMTIPRNISSGYFDGFSDFRGLYHRKIHRNIPSRSTSGRKSGKSTRFDLIY
uniref:Uncharacterized protein n=1 Tax=Brassica oleracea var. oleracea TaxID=109376 RepID=A0A0D2ZXQ3_BRAOL